MNEQDFQTKLAELMGEIARCPPRNGRSWRRSPTKPSAPRTAAPDCQQPAGKPGLPAAEHQVPRV